MFRWRYEQRIIEQRNPGPRGSTHSFQENSNLGNILEQKFLLMISFILKNIILNDTNRWYTLVNIVLCELYIFIKVP